MSKIIATRLFFFSFVFYNFFNPLICFAQSLKYVSPVDQDLTIKSIFIYPIVDNMKNVYGNPVTENLKATLEKDKQWVLVNDGVDKKHTPEELEENSNLVKSILVSTKSDALLAGRISKGPGGISIKLTLYVGKEGLPIGQETLTNFDGYELKDLNLQVEGLVKKLKAKLPYNASILSRKGNLVTVNLGSYSGLRANAELTAVQIYKIDRHPKFKILVNSENIILGKIVINKVDEFISFGTVVSERESNLISQGSKILVDRQIVYPPSMLTADGKLNNDIGQRGDAQLAFGEQPTEWLPERTPSFGKVGILIGLGGYTLSNTLSTGGVSSSAQVVPSIHVNGELWISPNWFSQLLIRSFAFTTSNTMSGSSPGTLNVNANQTSLIGGYNFLIHDDFFGPKIQLSAGLSTMKAFVDNSSPTAFESVTYSGLMLGIAGSFPMQLKDKKSPLNIGGKLDFFLNPSLSESPTTSGGSSSNLITAFSIFSEYQFSQRMGFKSEMTFNLFSSSFSGAGSRPQPASSASHSITTIAAGLQYMF